MTDKNKTLFKLDELSDYKVASEYSDVRGWEVKDINNRLIGKVEHLLVNKVAERVVYLDVEVDNHIIQDSKNLYHETVNADVHVFVNEEGENHLLIPVGMVNIDENNKIVNTIHIDQSTIALAKRFRKDDAVDFAYELDLVRHYRGDKTIHTSNSPEGFYDRDDFNNPFNR